LLEEFIKNGYDVDKLKPYEEFLNQCQYDDYEDLMLQKHHILPKFMSGSNKKTNLIRLDIKDHFDSHIILAKCFERKTKEYHYNLCSANRILASAKRLLNKLGVDYTDSEFWNEARKNMKEYCSGENNPMYGRKHTEESKQKNREKKLKYRGENHPCYGKPSPLKGRKLKPRSYKCKQPNRNYSGENNPNHGKKRSPEWKEKHSNLIKSRMKDESIRSRLRSPKKKLGESPHSKRVMDTRTGIEYDCITNAKNDLKLNWYSYKKLVDSGILIVMLKNNDLE